MKRTITAADIERLPEGSILPVEPGALVTPLAADLARARGIRLESTPPGAGPGPVALGSDHAGLEARRALRAHLEARGVRVLDLGTDSDQPVDYPDFARRVAESVARGESLWGIVIDGAGIGSCMAANKVPGVLAALCYDAATARNSREHNYANVLALGARMLPLERLLEVADIWLATPFGEERHGRRVQKIREIERHYSRRKA